jgi:dipeptidyl aminopeptidase/acylaminoacyl peptidase
VATGAGGPRRPISVEDLFRVRWLSQPRLSPDGDRAAVTLTWLDRDRDKLVSQVAWLTTNGYGELVSESPTAGRDQDPTWAPDGRRLAFVSDRSGRPEIWLVDTSLKSARPLTNSSTGASGPSWSPTGEWLAFVASEPDQPRPAGGYTVARFHWKADGVGVIGQSTRRHIWLVPDTGGAARRLTDGDWDDDLPRFSPDGRTLAFRSNRTAGRATSSASELWLVPVDGSAAPQLLVAAVGAIRMHAWSPDGRFIAYLGHHRGDAQGVNSDVWLIDVASGEERNLTEHLDRPMGQWVRSDPPGTFLPPDLAWSPAGDAVYTVYADGGTSQVARIGIDGRVTTILGGQVGWFGFGVASTAGGVAALGASSDDPGELVVASADGSAARTITSVASEWRSGVQFGRLERFEFDAPDGARLEAWLQHPAGFASDERLPLILHIHGGPHWPIGGRLNMEFRRLAEGGFRVLYLNPRGAMGYGNAYAQANVGDWGGIDARDLLRAVDVAAARPDVDPDRIGVTGESYGGWMTNWLIATTTRFAAAVTQNSISDMRSEYLTTDDPPGFDWDMGGSPWQQPERYEGQSPLKYVDQIRAPLLLVSSELDQNCPINQSEQLYTALQLLGREAQFLRIPGEGHLINLVGRPSSRLARIRATDAWFRRHLRGEADEPASSDRTAGPPATAQPTDPVTPQPLSAVSSTEY